jgi:hypothetical protein
MNISFYARVLPSLLAGLLLAAAPAGSQTKVVPPQPSFNISEFDGTLQELEAMIPQGPSPEASQTPPTLKTPSPAAAESDPAKVPPAGPVATPIGSGGGPLCEDPDFNANSRPRLLLERYFSSRQAFRDHYVRNAMDVEGNLTGDGIGTWDAQKRRYSYAGYGLPMAQMIMTYNAPGGNGRPNYLRNGDIPINLGRYIALLCSEYDLLGQNGQFQARKKP